MRFLLNSKVWAAAGFLCFLAFIFQTQADTGTGAGPVPYSSSGATASISRTKVDDKINPRSLALSALKPDAIWRGNDGVSKLSADQLTFLLDSMNGFGGGLKNAEIYGSIIGQAGDSLGRAQLGYPSLNIPAANNQPLRAPALLKATFGRMITPERRPEGGPDDGGYGSGGSGAGSEEDSSPSGGDSFDSGTDNTPITPGSGG